MSKKNKTATTKAPKPPTSSVKPTGRAKLVAQLERVAFRVSNLSKRLRDSDSEEEMRDALLEIGRKLQPVISAASELPDNWGARTSFGGQKASWVPGTAVQIGEKHRERYNGLLDAKEMTRLTVKVIVAKTARCSTKDGDTVIIPIMHLVAVEEAA